MIRIGSLFSGYGGLERGVQAVLGGTVAWHSEIDPGACKILAHHYPDVPNLGDITAVDWSAVDPVDVLTGGSPCQDVSAAGKRAGMRAGTRSGLWASMCDAIDIIRPALVVWENVRGVLSAGADSAVEPCPVCVGDERDAHLRALGRVLGDLAELGYDARWGGLRAADVGAPHGRYRVFIVAWPADTLGPTGAITRSIAPGSPEGAAAEAVGRAGRGSGAPTADTHGAASGQRRLAAPGQAESGRARADAGGRGRASATDSGCHPRPQDDPDQRASARHRRVAAHADGDGLEGVGRLHAVGRDADRRSGADIAWGNYEPAIRRWEGVLGRPAPAPTELSAKGSPRLSARFVEWLMGLPDGWVTDVPGITRNEALKALGNGVVPQQAAAALRLLLPDVATPPTSVEIGGAA